MAIRSRVPADPNISREMRIYLDSLSRANSLSSTLVDQGTVSGGTFVIDPNDGALQKIVNNGAMTITPADSTGRCVLHITNGSSAGVITFSGWTHEYTGDSLTTTNGNKFAVEMNFFDTDGADYLIRARQ